MNRTGRLRCDVTWNAAGKGELFEQPPQPLLVLRDVGIDFAVGAFEVGVGHQPGPAVTRPSDVNHVQVLFLAVRLQRTDGLRHRGVAERLAFTEFAAAQSSLTGCPRICTHTKLMTKELNIVPQS